MTSLLLSWLGFGHLFSVISFCFHGLAMVFDLTNLLDSWLGVTTLLLSWLGFNLQSNQPLLSWLANGLWSNHPPTFMAWQWFSVQQLSYFHGLALVFGPTILPLSWLGISLWSNQPLISRLGNGLWSSQHLLSWLGIGLCSNHPPTFLAWHWSLFHPPTFMAWHWSLVQPPSYVLGLALVFGPTSLILYLHFHVV